MIDTTLTTMDMATLSFMVNAILLFGLSLIMIYTKQVRRSAGAVGTHRDPGNRHF